ncbi:DUF1153 domain-containing protein [Paenibacillus sp. FSL H8-0537]|uniref:DUF1153 domain-containing protein n=1 Tax=Paenibacillus sp. FSL H8-0537 TaxID=2921399 RepID=UPI003100CC21
MSREKYNNFDKFTILEEVSNGEIGFLEAAKKYGINKTILMKWQRRYKTHGYEGLERPTHLQKYSAKLKHEAVKDYLEGGLPQYQIIDKYKISSMRMLFNWINKYNGHSSLTANKGEATVMTKGHTTTWQEQIEIVQYGLTNQCDYQKTTGQFEVSYSKYTNG